MLETLCFLQNKHKKRVWRMIGEELYYLNYSTFTWVRNNNG